MFKTVMREKLYCGLDLGNHRIKAAVIKIHDLNHVEFIGGYSQKTNGFKEGAVVDLRELSGCIHTTLQMLMQKFNVTFKEISFGINSELVTSKEVEAVIPLMDRAGKVITLKDIKRVSDQARLLGIKMDEELIHEIPQTYSVDDVNSILNPLGLNGRKLEVHTLMILGLRNRIENIIRAVHEAGFDAAHLFLNSFTAAEIVLTQEERTQGCILVDIGAKLTNVFIFKDGFLKKIEKIAMGGDNFTLGIAQNLHLPFELAEDIKKSYASVLAFPGSPEEEILIKTEGGYKPIKKSLIDHSVEIVTQEFLRCFVKIVKESSFCQQRAVPIIMIGGGSLLSGLIERMGIEINSPVRLGKLINIRLQRNLENAAVFNAAVGLAYYGYQKNFKKLQVSSSQAHWARNFTSKMKDLYEEYF